jgi:hypothetical protein
MSYSPTTPDVTSVEWICSRLSSAPACRCAPPPVASSVIVAMRLAVRLDAEAIEFVAVDGHAAAELVVVHRRGRRPRQQRRRRQWVWRRRQLRALRGFHHFPLEEEATRFMLDPT